jgi:hypothetical protein
MVTRSYVTTLLSRVNLRSKLEFRLKLQLIVNCFTIYNFYCQMIYYYKHRPARIGDPL